MSFPRSADQLDDDFLGRALGFGVALRSVEPVGVGRGFVGELARVTYEASGRTATLIAKFSSSRPETRAAAHRAGNYRREVEFYRSLAAVVGVRVPRCSGAWLDENTGEFVLLLEDVPSDPDVDQLVGLDPARAEAVIRSIARLHARTWRDDRWVGVDWLPRLATRRANLTALAAAGAPQLMGWLAADGRFRPGDASAIEQLPDRIGDVLTRLEELPMCVVHSDLRLDNILFPPTGEPVVLDWQGVGLGPPSWDLAYFLTQSLTVEARRAYEEPLLAAHHAAVRSEGVDVPITTLHAGYVDALWFGLVVACAVVAIASPGDARSERIAIAMASRAIAALGDHSAF